MGLVGAGSPHNYRPKGLPRPDVTIENLVDKAAFNRFLQQPNVPDDLLDHHVRQFFNVIFRSGYLTADYLRTLPQDSPERRMDFPSMLAKKELPGTLFLPESALSFYVDTFTATGFTGAINWYRAMPETIAAIGKRKVTRGLSIPYLYVWFEQDPITRGGVEAYMIDYIEDFEMQKIACGHMGSEEKPDQLSDYLVDWLTRKFPAEA